MTVQSFQLQIELLTAASPGRGDGVAGLVDMEVEHEKDTGLPLIKSRTIKGLLADECANIMYSLRSQQNAQLEDWERAAKFIFGSPGSLLSEESMVVFGSARLHPELRSAVRHTLSFRAREKTKYSFTQNDVLEAVTVIRRQSSEDLESGCPEDGSFRSTRVLLPGLLFFAPITFLTETPDLVPALLGACALALRHLGSRRNRGRGACKCRLLDDEFSDTTGTHMEQFERLVGGHR